MMIDKILVPLDGSKLAEQILPYARLLAQVYSAPVELLSVDGFEGGTPFSSSAGAMTHLKKISVECFPTSLHVDAVIERGNPAEVIVDRAKQSPGCLIAMATHGRSGVKRLLLGSTASKVVQASAGPLLLVRAAEMSQEPERANIQAVIVPLDGSEVAETMLPPATDVAKSLNAELVLARAFQVPPTAYYRTEDVPPVAEPFIPTYDDLVADEIRESQEYLGAKAKEARSRGVDKVRTEVLNGPAAEEIVKLARITEGSLIAICTHGRSGVRRWLLGSVTEKVVQLAESPILIVRAR
jgi:nucleotide-binding universal stress UspA family protein